MVLRREGLAANGGSEMDGLDLIFGLGYPGVRMNR
jgi:hypothetical protein